jgi:predicted metal-dependent hydrolase
MHSESAVEQDARFTRAVTQFNARDYDLAGDAFEELFLEAVRDEVEFVRVFLQVSAGLHHVERGQRRAAVERLEEALLAIERVTNDRGLDLAALTADVRRMMPVIARGEWPVWPTIRKRAS